MKRKNTWLLLGWVLFLLGVTSLIMQMIGIHWYFLSFLEWSGRLSAFVIKILMVMGGVFLIVLANTDWERERQESNQGER